jgi:hypothetical protein
VAPVIAIGPYVGRCLDMIRKTVPTRMLIAKALTVYINYAFIISQFDVP